MQTRGAAGGSPSHSFNKRSLLHYSPQKGLLRSRPNIALSSLQSFVRLRSTVDVNLHEGLEVSAWDALAQQCVQPLASDIVTNLNKLATTPRAAVATIALPLTPLRPFLTFGF